MVNDVSNKKFIYLFKDGLTFLCRKQVGWLVMELSSSNPHTRVGPIEGTQLKPDFLRGAGW